MRIFADNPVPLVVFDPIVYHFSALKHTKAFSYVSITSCSILCITIILHYYLSLFISVSKNNTAHLPIPCTMFMCTITTHHYILNINKLTAEKLSTWLWGDTWYNHNNCYIPSYHEQSLAPGCYRMKCRMWYFCQSRWGGVGYVPVMCNHSFLN